MEKASCGVFEGYIYFLLLPMKIVSRGPTDLSEYGKCTARLEV
jgi:hypothetical protein